MPYPQRTAGFVTAFINSQRPPPGSHLSAFLHGESTMGGSRKDRPSNAHNVTTRRATAPDLVAPMDEFGAPHNPDLRPRASTMSIIDPMHSPVLGIRRHGQSTTMFDDVSRDPEHGARGVFHPDAQLDWREEAVFKNPDRKQKPRKSATEVWEPSAPKPMLFPKVKDRRVRQKSIGTLISGTLLTLVLTTYLALATSNVVPTATFHAVFIFFILILTIIFGHFLVRLCMLAFPSRRPPPAKVIVRKRDARGKTVLSTGPAVRSALPQSRRPIRLLPPYTSLSSPILQRQHRPDSSPSSPATAFSAPSRPICQSSHGIRTVGTETDADGSGEVDLEKALPNPPPPAYGRWRNSIRIDNPEHVVDLQQLTRQLVLAGVRNERTDEGDGETYDNAGRRRSRGVGLRPRGAHSRAASSESSELLLRHTDGPTHGHGRQRGHHHSRSRSSGWTGTRNQQPPSYSSRSPADRNVIGVNVDVDVDFEIDPAHQHQRDDGFGLGHARQTSAGTGTTSILSLAPPPLFAGPPARNEREGRQRGGRHGRRRR